MAAATELNGTGYVRFVQPDVTFQANVDAAAEQIAKDFGHLDAMVNNAGANTLTRRHLDHLPKPTEETADDLRFVYEVNVFAVVGGAGRCPRRGRAAPRLARARAPVRPRYEW
jgi:NAD(P)-dependent dehydrogenase (short-subunit alcohol dehydrogenase family)